MNRTGALGLVCEGSGAVVGIGMGVGFGGNGRSGAVEIGPFFSLVCSIGRVSFTGLLIGVVSELCCFSLEIDRTMNIVFTVIADAQTARSAHVALSSDQ